MATEEDVTDVNAPPSDKKKSREWSLKPIKNVFSSLKTKIKSFRKKSGIDDAEERLFAQLRNTTFSQKLKEKYNRPDTSFARVEIFLNDFVEEQGGGEYDIDVVLAALKNLNKLLL